MEISSNTMSRYESIIKNMLPRIGENKMVSAVTTEDLLYVRKELLTGFHVMKKDHRTQVKGRKSSTVNNYMMLMAEIFQFGADNGYAKETRLAELTVSGRQRRTRSTNDRRVHQVHSGMAATSRCEISGPSPFILE